MIGQARLSIDDLLGRLSHQLIEQLPVLSAQAPVYACLKEVLDGLMPAQ